MRAYIFEPIAISKLLVPANTRQSDRTPYSDIAFASISARDVSTSNIDDLLTFINEHSVLVIEVRARRIRRPA
jgi:hypothetical protein